MSVNPEVNAYKGRGSEYPEAFSRDLRECEQAWNCSELKPGTLDDMLMDQLEIAKNAGRQVVNVLDLGCGSGAVIRNIVNDSFIVEKQMIAKSRNYLEHNPNLRVRIIGLTDATDEAQFLNREPILTASYITPAIASQQIQAEIIYYSITNTQTFKQFLDEASLQDLNLVVSTGFFVYLGRDSLFQQVFSDVIDALEAGGRLIAFKYASYSFNYTSLDYLADKLFGYLDSSGGDLTNAAEKLLEEIDDDESVELERRKKMLEEFASRADISLQYSDCVVVADKR